MYLAARIEGKVRIEWRGRGGELRSSTKRITVVHAEVLYRAIIWVHREAGHEWPYAEPQVMRVMKGMRRTHGKPPRRVAALEIGTLKAGLVGYKAPWPPERRLRDVTLLSLGFFGALRRGELLALCVEDIEFVPEGMVITIRKSKTDQERQGAQLGIPSQKDPAICPVALTRQWLAWMKDEAYITAGHLFRRMDTNGCLGTAADHERRGGPRALVRRAGGAGPQGVRRALAEGRVHHERGEAGRLAAEDHAAVAAQERADGDGVHPAGDAVRRQRGRWDGR